MAKVRSFATLHELTLHFYIQITTSSYGKAEIILLSDVNFLIRSSEDKISILTGFIN